MRGGMDVVPPRHLMDVARYVTSQVVISRVKAKGLSPKVDKLPGRQSIYFFQPLRHRRSAGTRTELDKLGRMLLSGITLYWLLPVSRRRDKNGSAGCFFVPIFPFLLLFFYSFPTFHWYFDELENKIYPLKWLVFQAMHFNWQFSRISWKSTRPFINSHQKATLCMLIY